MIFHGSFSFGLWFVAIYDEKNRSIIEYPGCSKCGGTGYAIQLINKKNCLN